MSKIDTTGLKQSKGSINLSKIDINDPKTKKKKIKLPKSRKSFKTVKKAIRNALKIVSKYF